MMKSVNMSINNNLVADQNFSRVFEISPYRMPAANMAATFNIIWNSTQRNDSPADMVASKGGMSAYTCSCIPGAGEGGLSPQNSSLEDLLGNADGTDAQVHCYCLDAVLVHCCCLDAVLVHCCCLDAVLLACRCPVLSCCLDVAHRSAAA